MCVCLLKIGVISKIKLEWRIHFIISIKYIQFSSVHIYIHIIYSTFVGIIFVEMLNLNVTCGRSLGHDNDIKMLNYKGDDMKDANDAIGLYGARDLFFI